MQPKDSVELHNLPLCIKIACKKRDDTDEISNEIKGYEKKEAAFSTSTTTPRTPAPQSINNTPPWQR